MVNQVSYGSIKKWQDFLATDLTVPADGPRVETFTPLSGTALAQNLSEGELRRLYWLFLSFYGEAFITLEQALMVNLRAGNIATKPRQSGQVLSEELYHSRAFAAVIKAFAALRLPHDYIFRGRHRRLRNAIAWVARHFPDGLALPAAKFEVFTINYGRYVAKHFPAAHPWAKVNLLHIEDELGHVTFDFAWHQLAMGQSPKGRLKAVIGALLFTALTQVMAVSGAIALINLALPARSVWQRGHCLLAFLKWNLRTFVPYNQSRASMRRHFHRHTPRYGRLFAFMHW